MLLRNTSEMSFQREVAVGMAELIVHDLEVIDVDHQQRGIGRP